MARCAAAPDSSESPAIKTRSSAISIAPPPRVPSALTSSASVPRKAGARLHGSDALAGSHAARIEKSAYRCSSGREGASTITFTTCRYSRPFASAYVSVTVARPSRFGAMATEICEPSQSLRPPSGAASPQRTTRPRCQKESSSASAGDGVAVRSRLVGGS
eukprot:6398401-Prymnesium_polylepis.2